MPFVGQTIARLEAQVGLDDAKLQEGLRRTSSTLDSWAKKSEVVGKKLFVGLTLPILAAAGASLKLATDFNKAMAEVATLIPNNIERVRELGDSVRELAILHGKDVKDVAAGLYQTISLFGDEAEVTVTKLRIASEAATAGLASTTDVITVLKAVTAAYGNETAEAVQHASDLAFTAVRLGGTTLPELANSMGRVTATASQLGISQEELFAVYATGTGPLGKADIVTTMFGATLKALLNPTDALIALFTKLEFASAQAAITGLGYQGVIAAIVKETEDSKRPLADFIGQGEAFPLVFGLASKLADQYTSKLGEMSDVLGATGVAFGAQTQGVNAAGFAWEQLKRKVLDLGIEFGQILTPEMAKTLELLEPNIDKALELAKAYSGLDDSTKTAILNLILMATALAPLILLGSKVAAGAGLLRGAFIAISRVVGGTSTALGSLGAALGLSTGGIALLIAAIVGLGAAVVTNFGNIRTNIVWAFRIAGQGALEFGQLFATMAQSVIDTWFFVVVSIHRLVTGQWSEAWEAAKRAGGSFVKVFTTIFGTIPAALARIVGQLHIAVIGGIVVLIASVGEKMNQLGQRMIDEVKKPLKMRSPSRVMMEIGRDVVKGLAIGIDTNAVLAGKAGAKLAKETAESIRDQFQSEFRFLALSLAEAQATTPLGAAQARFPIIPESLLKRYVDLKQALDAIEQGSRQTAEAAFAEEQAHSVLTDELARQQTALARLLATSEAERVALDLRKQPLSELTEAEQALVQSIAVFRSEQVPATEALIAANDAVKRAQIEYLKLVAATDAERLSLDRYQKTLAELPAALRQAISAEDAWNALIEKQKSDTESLNAVTQQHESRIESLTDAIQKLALERAVLLGVSDAESEAISRFDERLKSLEPDVRALLETFSHWKRGNEELRISQEAATSILNTANDSAVEAKRRWGELTATNEASRRSWATLGAALEEQPKAIQDIIRESTFWSLLSNQLIEKREREADAIRDQTQTTERLRDALESQSFALRQLTGDATAYETLLSDLGLLTATLTDEQGALIGEIQRTQEEVKRLESIREVLSDLAGGMKSLFKSALGELSHGFSAFFSSIIRGFEQLLIDMAQEWLASQLVQLITGVIGSAFGVRAPQLALAGARAHGGPVDFGRAYLVGESGPEVFVPSRFGRVVSNDQIDDMGPFTFAPIFNITTPNPDAFRRSQRQLIAESWEQAATMRRRNRGPTDGRR